MNFYYLHFNEDDDGDVACSTGGPVTEVAQLDSEPPAEVQFSLTASCAQDYQANDLGWPLMSERLKSALDMAEDGNLVWHKVSLIAEGREFEYYVPHFLSPRDVLDLERSKIVHGPIGDLIIKACLSAEKVHGLEFFPLPGSEIRLVISERLKKRIEIGKMSGVDFSDVPMK